MKKIGLFLLQIIILMFSFLLTSLISGMIVGSEEILNLTEEQQFIAGKGLVYVSFFYSALLLYLCKKINLYGIKLFLAILTLHYGITVFLTHIESFMFLDYSIHILPKGALPVLVLDLSISTICYSFLVIIISGKWKQKDLEPIKNLSSIPLTEIIVKVGILSISYYFIYILFGSYVLLPLAGKEAFNQYYGGLQLPSWFPLFQMARGIIWVLIALPVISNFKGRVHEIAIAIGLSYSILMGINLLIPTPIMPERIRLAHFVEVMSSNFLFGIIVAYVITWKINKNKTVNSHN